MSVKEISVDLIAKGLKVGIIVSRFNDFLTKELLSGAIDCLVRHGATEDDVTVVWVPGANESPIVANKMAGSAVYDAIVVLGAVVQGATPHADLINNQVSRSLSQIAVSTGTPVINGVVCTQNLEQAIERSGTKSGNKGWNAAQAAVEMANLIKLLD
ncbi:MAG: 6,7-dimethyl-8-ribityllumazine synthase [Kiritimatiellae bacterium]|nr:6,7-dimethyl-8-ribityllumazine synthase [Kiritimatiellia bacterium]